MHAITSMPQCNEMLQQVWLCISVRDHAYCMHTIPQYTVHTVLYRTYRYGIEMCGQFAALIGPSAIGLDRRPKWMKSCMDVGIQ